MAPSLLCTSDASDRSGKFEGGFTTPHPAVGAPAGAGPGDQATLITM